MANLNKVFLIGNLTRDPELRYTPGGAAVCNFGLAVNRRYTSAKGEEQEETCFVDIETWGKQAENSNNYLRKGSATFIEGRLRFDQWDDRETGKKRSRLTVSAFNIQFLNQPSRSESAGMPAGARSDNSDDFSDRRKVGGFERDPGPPSSRPEPPPFPAGNSVSGQDSNKPESSDADDAVDDIPF